MLQFTQNHETLIRKASEQAVFARTVGYFYINLIWIETALLFQAENPKKQEILKSSRLKAVLTDHVKIGPVTGIEVFKSAGTLVIEVQVLS